MLLIPVHDLRRHADQRRAAQPVAARLGPVPHVAKPDRLCPGQRTRGRSAAGQRGADEAPGPRLVAQHPRPLRRRQHPGRGSPSSTGSIPAARPRRSSSGASGPTARSLGSFELTARNSDDLPRMMAEGVQRMDELFVAGSLRPGIVRGDPDLIIQPPPPEEEEVVEEAPTVALLPPTVVQVLVIERGDAMPWRSPSRRSAGSPELSGSPKLPCPMANANLSVNFRGDAALAWVGFVVARLGSHEPRRCPLRNARCRSRGRASAFARPSHDEGKDQIALPLDWPQAQDDSRFILSEANRAAFEHFRSWSLWPVKATMLTGPRRSGRSLLARAFVDRVGGRLFENAERHDEEELFHAWNAAQDSGKPIVMIVDEVPPAWEVALAGPSDRIGDYPDCPDRAAGRCTVPSDHPAAVRRSRAAYPRRGAEIHRRAGRAELLDGRAGGRGDRPLRHRRARRG